MANLFDIGRSGLNSYRQSLAVTGQNIANINTDGYKRRGAELEELSGARASVLESGQGSGMGVRIGNIRRAFDEFLLNKVRSATAYSESSSAFANAAAQVENILLPGEANLGNAIGRFFEGLQEVASDPADLIGRTVAIEQAKQVSDNFNQLHTLLEEMKGGLFTQSQHLLDEVNILTVELQRINKQLAAGSGTKVNNSLLDARDNLIDKLNEYVEVHVTLDKRGAAKVVLGDTSNGPSLVTPQKVSEIGVEQRGEELLFFIEPKAEKILTKRITGGEVNGLSVAYKTAVEVLEEVDSLAFEMVRDINAIHKQGLTMEGEQGSNFFQSLRLDLTASAVNTGDASATLKILDPDAITSDRVRFNYDENKDIWRGTLDDGSALVEGRGSIVFNGVEITFIGEANLFDEFVYNPVKGSAGGVDLALRRPQDVAAAAALIVTSNPNNKSQVLIDALPHLESGERASTLPNIRDIFSNYPSAVAATSFLAGGSVARIPENITSIDLLSLKKQGQVQFSLSDANLSGASTITLSYENTDDAGFTVSDTITFDIDYNTFRGSAGTWKDAEQISDLLNRGIIKGRLASNNSMVALTEIGGFCSGSEGQLNFSIGEGNYTSATIDTSSTGVIDGVVSLEVDSGSEIQIFTREGRHVAGTQPSDAKIIEYQSLMLPENGFNKDAVYVGDYLNGSADVGYMGMSVVNLDQTGMLTEVIDTDGGIKAEFRLIDGIDTDEVSTNGLSSVAKTRSYEMTIDGTTKAVGAADVKVLSGEGVAQAMIEKFRADAPIASIIGSTVTPIDGDEVQLTFEGKTYKITIDNGEALVNGGEPDRLLAYFDSQDRLNVVATAGTIGKSQIEVLIDNSVPENVEAAQRLGLMDGLVQVATSYSDEGILVNGTGSSAESNTITLTFSEDDTYHLSFVFDDHPNSGSTAATNKQLDISAAMVGGDATDIAAAINDAITNNIASGADMSGVASVSVSGNELTLTINDGSKVEILRDGDEISSGTGQVTINPVTMGGAQKTLDDAYVSPGYELVRDGSSVSSILQVSGSLDEGLVVNGTGSSAQSNEIKLTFSEDDTYHLAFIFDNKPDSGNTSPINKQLNISAAMTNGDATAISDAINLAIANNLVNGADMSGVASVSVSGNELTLTIHDGSRVEILRDGDRISDGSGQLIIDPTTTNADTKTLADAPVVTATGKSLVDQRLTLSDLPDEELILFISDSGARRIAMQFDEVPEGAPSLIRDLEIRVKDKDTKTIEIFDSSTETSVATRTLDQFNKTIAVGFEFELDGTFDADDKFHINANSQGVGDNRNLLAILDLQSPPSNGAGSGGFQKKFNNAVSRLGSIVQSGKIAAASAIALKEASVEAESEYSGVNLDSEAANLIQQQQAYQASARILSTARELFETLIQVV